MDVFELNEKLIADYSSYIKSFISIKDDRIKNYVEEHLMEHKGLWPEPLVQLNPFFKPGELIDELCEKSVLHRECGRIFRKDKSTEGDFSKPLRLYRHQADAIKHAAKGENYVLTTGTGSGKSLAYIVPIVDYILRTGSGKGIRAIVVYPMNALANSQYGELEKFICRGYPNGKGLVTFEKYTGQESEEKKEDIINNPPDILLTNYVMLELILTRARDRKLIESSADLRFLVLDELHTYRGRQGADVSMLVRRLRNLSGSLNMQYVGTSATIAGDGDFNEKRHEVAEVASLLFGAKVKDECIVGESLQRVTQERDIDSAYFLKTLAKRISQPDGLPSNNFLDFIQDPLAIWIESVFGVSLDKMGRLIRSVPRNITGSDGVVAKLAAATGLTETVCAQAVQKCLLSGFKCVHPETGLPVFAFRLHQFISKGDTVYASLESEQARHLTMDGQQFVPGDRTKLLYPLVFCRECGQEYYSVNIVTNKDTGQREFVARDVNDRLENDEGEQAYLYLNTIDPWPDSPGEQQVRCPEEFWDAEGKLKSSHRKYLPQKVFLTPGGATIGEGLVAQLVRAPFRFCLHCGVAYSARHRKDFQKLATLGTEGRSTATTVLCLSAIRNLRQDETLEKKARKLLCFTDNRQDASLQSGHFNDFVEVGLLRAALYKAAKKAGVEGIEHDELPLRVFEAIDLPLESYAENPEKRYGIHDIQRALRDVIGYRLYHDLRRGWRIIMPNLEQCGLLTIEYKYLGELCRNEEDWQGCHPALVTAAPETREKVARVLLDHMRRSLAIKVDYLDKNHQEMIQQKSSQYLKAPWAIDENENLAHAAVLYPRSIKKEDYGGNVFLSTRGAFGMYLRRKSTFAGYPEPVGSQDTEVIIRDLLERLQLAGLVEVVDKPRAENEVGGFQVPAAAIRWLAGDGASVEPDPMRIINPSVKGMKPNKFFVEYYRSLAFEAKGIGSREHTAQVPYELRVEREDLFREGDLPILYCSPTMELGVDIAQLNAVNLRNIPPTPANYAQRSGRAGRSGQPALVFSYCSTGNSHDQYFFRRPHLMVSGSVTPPRIDIANEDLIRSHIQAIWLSETGVSLGRSLADILDVASDEPSLKILPSVVDSFRKPVARERAKVRAVEVLKTIEGLLLQSDWYSENWLADSLTHVFGSFEVACTRWRNLYGAALSQHKAQNRIIQDAARSFKDKERAKGLRRDAERQLQLLIRTDNYEFSDFYSYRYFASEGFLPGYNFPRLPLSAYIPGKRTQMGERKDEYLSRPRFLAITEFGPRSVVYHEGARYEVNRVIMPVGEERDIATNQAKICSHCGYLHPTEGEVGPDLCERCGHALPPPLRQLFLLENVSTRRRDKINSDEEERVRLGYEILTSIRFAEYGGLPGCKTATVKLEGKDLLALTYGQSATVRRINKGWRRRNPESPDGFYLDVERGYWAKNEMDEVDEQDPLGNRVVRVIPYVEDSKNSLLIEPIEPLTLPQMASLQAALKSAIQVVYQLEDNELAAEPLPGRDDRKQILLYESAEGGAGVLRRLVEDPGSLGRVSEKALEICHFNPGTGEDLRRAPRAKEDCEAACYNCLMSYTNQMDHPLLDRKGIVSFLLGLAAARVEFSPTLLPRAEQLARLKRQCDSELERQWLDFLNERNLNLPEKAQHLVAACRTRPDFYYTNVAIYIDGPHHDYPDRQKRDAEQTECMEDHGIMVIRFGYRDDWERIISDYPSIFGRAL